MKRTLFASLVSRNTFAFAALALAVLMGSVVSARAWLRPDASVPDAAPPAPPAAVRIRESQRDATAERVESEVITVLATGFNPSEITRPRGPFLILFENRTGLDEINLRLDRVAGGRLREVRQSKQEPITRQLEDLPPGEYLLTEAAHPEWACRITITPR